MIDNFILFIYLFIFYFFPDFVELGTLGHQINATGPKIGVCFHRPQSKRGIEKIKSTRGPSSGRG